MIVYLEMETNNTLTAQLDACETPEALMGGLEALIGMTVPAAQAKELAEHIVTTAGFDTPESLRDMDYADLVGTIPAVGYRKRVSRALFNGTVLSAADAVGVVPGAAPPPAVPVNVTVSAPPPPVRKWSLEWPEDSSPETLLDWGMTIRAHLVDKDKVFAELVWGRFIQAWTDIPSGDHTDGNDLDVYLSKDLR